MLNTITVQGRITRDIEVRNGKVATFNVAVDRDYKSKDGNRPVDFIPVQVWRESLIKLLTANVHKGDEVTITGSLYMNQYTAKDGSNRTTYVINADNVYFHFVKKTADTADPKESNGDDLVDIQSNEFEDEIMF